MRKLNRRLLRWRRYIDKTCFNPRIVQPWAWQPSRGYQRAAWAVGRDRRERRFWDETPALIADVIGDDSDEQHRLIVDERVHAARRLP